MSTQLSLDIFMRHVIDRNPGETVFHQSVHEVAQTIIPFLQSYPEYVDARILERMVEPDRTISFRVQWADDRGQICINRGYRVQFNNAIGPYKGGLRFHPTVDPSVLKFLGFEQIFKNSLTALPLGAGKGGSDFDPKGKSDLEIMRFCQAFMTELANYIGPDIDIPAGDIGVGSREIGYMFGQYKRLHHHFSGVLTGKGRSYGGSEMRTEATGYGCVYFMENMLSHIDSTIAGKRCLVSGSGNVAQYCAEKIIALGGTVLTMSDSGGTIYDPAGIDTEKLALVKHIKNDLRGRISEYEDTYPATYSAGKKPWEIEADLAFPCATQNEIIDTDASALAKNGVIAIAEGANMPTSDSAYKIIHEANILFGPGKAANAGGVAVSGFEMSQNSQRTSWTAEQIESKLKSTMQAIHEKCVTHGENSDGVNYVQGANIAGFKRVADAMLAQGLV